MVNMNNAPMEYLRWYYENNIYGSVKYRNILTLKSVSDLWNYQEIIYANNIGWVIETGSRYGGSGLFFADVLSTKNAEGIVFSIDSDGTVNKAPPHSKLKFVIGDSGSEDLAKKILKSLPEARKSLFLILDADHTKAHVLRELNAYVPLLKKGDYVVVEDTCINGHPLRPDYGDGPFEAIHQYNIENEGLLIPDKKREMKFGFTFAPDGFYIRS